MGHLGCEIDGGIFFFIWPELSPGSGQMMSKLIFFKAHPSRSLLSQDSKIVIYFYLWKLEMTKDAISEKWCHLHYLFYHCRTKNNIAFKFCMFVDFMYYVLCILYCMYIVLCIMYICIMIFGWIHFCIHGNFFLENRSSWPGRQKSTKISKIRGGHFVKRSMLHLCHLSIAFYLKILHFRGPPAFAVFTQNSETWSFSFGNADLSEIYAIHTVALATPDVHSQNPSKTVEMFP